jgi:hypothetical protein
MPYKDSERSREQARRYREIHRDELRLKQREYGKRPEVRARVKERSKTPAQIAKSRSYHKAYRQKERAKEQIKKYMLKAIYGLSLEDFNSMMEGQGGACAICGTRNWGKTGPSVDHNHETGAVRGLLCNQCNSGLGMFRDNPGTVKLAVAYLERNA